MWVRNNKGNVFVGNLPPDFSDERLAETFDPFGIVLTAAIARDPATGARLRYGFVDIATERAATQAIAALDGAEVEGCKLNVKARAPRVKKPGGAPPRRTGFRAAAPSRISRDVAAAPPVPPVPEHPIETGALPSHRELAQSPGVQNPLAAEGAMAQSQAAPSRAVPSRVSQSQMIRDGAPEIERPPRRDFEVVRRPIRRTTTSTFQVERRPLPRRV